MAILCCYKHWCCFVLYKSNQGNVLAYHDLSFNNNQQSLELHPWDYCLLLRTCIHNKSLVHVYIMIDNYYNFLHIPVHIQPKAHMCRCLGASSDLATKSL